MAKRKKLTAPSARELSELEAGFAAKPKGPSLGGGVGPAPPPIAQVAAEAAATAAVLPPEQRAEAARDHRDAEAFRAAEAGGRLILELPTDQIAADEITRDRVIMDPEEMAELTASIKANGLRLPIEVFELPAPDPSGARYGLLSGYRRLAAVRALEAEGTPAGAAGIKALVREAGSVAQAYVSMVEENEVRADLTPYERGRVAVIAAGQGAFDSIESAVSGLFHVASKAKRSKIRAFALVHEELGDVLAWPENLSERAGLRLAAALRSGYAGPMRGALGNGGAASIEEEWALLEPFCAEAEAETRDPKRGGRPKKPSKGAASASELRHLGNGVALRGARDEKGVAIRVEGEDLDEDVLERAMAALAQALGPA